MLPLERYIATLGPSWNFNLSENLASLSLQDGPQSGIIIEIVTQYMAEAPLYLSAAPVYVAAAPVYMWLQLLYMWLQR